MKTFLAAVGLAIALASATLIPTVAVAGDLCDRIDTLPEAQAWRVAQTCVADEPVVDVEIVARAEIATPERIVKSVAPTVEDRPVKVAGCTNWPVLSSVDEQPDGTNCPPTAFETGVGQLLFGLTFFAIGAEIISGGEVFPLAHGVLAL